MRRGRSVCGLSASFPIRVWTPGARPSPHFVNRSPGVAVIKTVVFSNSEPARESVQPTPEELQEAAELLLG